MRSIDLFPRGRRNVALTDAEHAADNDIFINNNLPFVDASTTDRDCIEQLRRVQPRTLWLEKCFVAGVDMKARDMDTRHCHGIY